MSETLCIIYGIGFLSGFLSRYLQPVGPYRNYPGADYIHHTTAAVGWGVFWFLTIPVYALARFRRWMDRLPCPTCGRVGDPACSTVGCPDDDEGVE